MATYQLDHILYKSDNSIIYWHDQSEYGTPIIIKMLREEYPLPQTIFQFNNEYEFTHNLAIKGIRRAYRTEHIENYYALILEYVDAETVRNLFVRKRQPLADILRVAIRIAQTLGEIHQHNIIHKDLNSSNVLVAHPKGGKEEAWQVTIIDFGISSKVTLKHPYIVNPERLEGTLAYMSPEQTGRMNRVVDERTDLYSFGVTLYEMLTGTLPFDEPDPLALVHAHLARHPIPPHQIDPEIPEILSGIVLKLLAKNAEDRYQSAFGLKYDLEQCLEWMLADQVPGTSQVPDTFELGQHDVSGWFHIPQKLYGRAQDIDTVLRAFDRVATTGRSTLLLVTGDAGVGKSSLVHEIHKPMSAKRGHFVYGKFEALHRNIPYAAFVQTFEAFIKLILSQRDSEVREWKDTIQAAAGKIGKVLTDFIPNLEWLIGTQPDIPELEGGPAQNRFRYAVQNFVRAIAWDDHPLIIVIDDWQWVDGPSLNLLETLMTDETITHLLLIGTYREHEVDSAHPLMTRIQAIEQTETGIETIHVQNLTQQHVRELVGETLQGATSLTKNLENLADIVYKKTQGNPFFVHQFLHSLYEDELLIFDAQRMEWHWDLDQITALNSTENVIDLLANKVRKLPEATQQVLQLAACIGNRFDLATLAVIAEHPPAETNNALEQAVVERLLLPNRPHFSSVDPVDDIPLGYQFTHDRIHQAAYSLIEEEHKREIHLNIGWLLLANTSDGEREEQIFDLVNHLNLGQKLIPDQAEKKKLAELNLIAGRKAKASAAYQTAFSYLQAGLALLAPESWQRHYDMTLALYVETAEAAYLSGNFEEMDCLVEIALEHARTLLDKITIYEVNIQACFARVKFPEAVKIALSSLNMLGITFPERPNTLHIVLSLLQTKLTVRAKQLENAINLPEMQDPSLLAATRLMVRTVFAAYMTLPELVPLIIFKGIRLSVKHGNAPASGCAYAGYGFILCIMLRDIEVGYQLGQLALRLLERGNIREYHAKILLAIHAFVTYRKDHLRETFPALLEAYQSGLETGDFESAALALQLRTCHAYLSGKHLRDVERDMASCDQALAHLKQEAFRNYLRIHWQMVLNLMGQTEASSSSTQSDVTSQGSASTDAPPASAWCLIGEVYDEERMLPRHHEANDRNALFIVYSNKLMGCYLFHAYQQALEHARLTETYVDVGREVFAVLVFYMFEALTRLALYPTAGKADKRRYRNKVAANQKKLRRLARLAPMNFLHKYDLVEAERARVLGKDARAMEYYDKAIAGAREHDYIHEEALANELAAKFYLARGRQQIARTYMREARYCYLKWGAMAKVRHLEQTYPDLLVKTRDGRHLEGGAHLPKTPTSTVVSAGMLDVVTLMNASQTISGEMRLDKLLIKLMKLVIQNAGAQRGLLLLEEHGTWRIEAEGNVDDEEVKVLQSIPALGDGSTPLTMTVTLSEVEGAIEGSAESVGANRDALLPTSIVQYVARTQEPIVLNDATREGEFTQDPYILINQPKSLFCLPLLNQGKLTGMLYLENMLTVGAFPTERVEVLNLLSSQAAISIQNARLYTHLEDLVKERTTELVTANELLQQEIAEREKIEADLRHHQEYLEERVQEELGKLRQQEQLLIQKSKLESLGSLAAGIAHEINQPLTRIALGVDSLLLKVMENHQINPDLLENKCHSILESIHRTKQIIDHIRTFSRDQQSLHAERIDMNATINNALMFVQTQYQHHNITITSDLHATGWVLGNPYRLEQVILNALSNARDAIKAKSQGIESAFQSGSIHIRTYSNKDHIYIEIADTGSGIAEDALDRIFDPFFTTKPAGEGTGLGLSISYGIIKDMHGDITVKSRVGEGTVFTISLPRIE